MKIYSGLVNTATEKTSECHTNSAQHVFNIEGTV
jgi:hypothetical protein